MFSQSFSVPEASSVVRCRRGFLFDGLARSFRAASLCLGLQRMYRCAATQRLCIGGCRFEVVFPQIDIDAFGRRMIAAPKFTAVEFNRVAMLRLSAGAMGMGIGKDEDTPIAKNGPMMAAGVAWNPRMALGIQVTREYAIPGLEARMETLITA